MHQLTESARPTDESFRKVEQVMKEIQRTAQSSSYDHTRSELMATSQSVAEFLAQIL